jgi:hypothetical protein
MWQPGKVGAPTPRPDGQLSRSDRWIQVAIPGCARGRRVQPSWSPPTQRRVGRTATAHGIGITNRRRRNRRVRARVRACPSGSGRGGSGRPGRVGELAQCHGRRAVPVARNRPGSREGRCHARPAGLPFVDAAAWRGARVHGRPRRSFVRGALSDGGRKARS